MISVRITDLRGAADNLALVLGTIKRAQAVTTKPIYGEDLPSPRFDLLKVAEVPMHLAWFYIGLAGGGYGR